ncbi:DNA mismatch repair protein Msh6p [Trichomonascus vanleenenianus]|uniref:mismatch repair ATPase MSH6 n=1 Tax=Trichomonascus vanleenenianus TaxID=2268995 RepID=UPI003ECA49D5
MVKPKSSPPSSAQRTLFTFFKPKDDKENEKPTNIKSSPTPKEKTKRAALSNRANERSDPPKTPKVDTDPSSIGSPDHSHHAVDVSKTPLKIPSSPVRLGDIDEEEEDAVRPAKRRKRVSYKEDSDGENAPEDSEDEYKEDGMDVDVESDIGDFVVEDEEEEDTKPKATKKRSKPAATRLTTPHNSSPPPSNRSSAYETPRRPTTNGNSTPLSRFSVNSDFTAENDEEFKAHVTATPSRSHSNTPNHSKFKKENEERYSWLVEIRDAEGRLESDPEYDPRTLYIPKSAWNKFTPFEKQYWEVKGKMWDTVVFFKKGKFYELYEKDADIAHQQFDLKLAGGGRANMRLAGIPEMSFEYWASAFCAKGHKVAKVDQKETALAKEMRDAIGGGKKEEKVIKRELSYVLTGGTLMDEQMLVDDMSSYCMAIKQEEARFAACFVDTATGAFLITEFEDDADYSHFETLVAQTRPKELVLEKGRLSQRATRILKNNTSLETLWNYLTPTIEFWDPETAHEQLVQSRYFAAEDLDDLSNYPPVLKQVIEERPLSLSAFGGLLWYIKSLRIDSGLVSQGNFEDYKSVQMGTSMVLDGQSLQNLEIFANSFDGGAEGTLFKLLNRCITPFGKRKLKEWVCHPLMHTDKINARLDAVEYLMENHDVMSFLESRLVGLPDLERMLSRVHSKQIKVKDFVRVIESFNNIYRLISTVKEKYELRGVLAHLFNDLPHLEECLPQWSEAFDYQKAKDDGILVPEPGIEEEFDASNEKINGIEDELKHLMRQYKKEYKSQEICYRDSGKEIYLIEVPIKCVKVLPKSWIQMGATSKVKRFYSPEVKSVVRKLQEAQELHKVVAENVKNKLYDKFDVHRQYWLKTVQTFACVDCLISLAKTSQHLGEPSCRPQFTDAERGALEFKELRHPCYRGTDNFVPNDIHLGGDEANITLLTGANAAGKSTVLRMTCVAVIMAQIGSYVPAELAQLTPVDRIMTRLGANDNIFAGKSTFHVELSETKRILSEATPKSLLVLDELGRGGSSNDGFAIAEAVLHHLATFVGSMGYFATHYGTLYNSFEKHPQVEAKRMAILVDEESRRVTYLYKLENGVSPGSFGMNVASMCGIDRAVVERAEQAAKQYEHTSRMKNLLDVQNSDMLPLGIQSDFVFFTKNSGAHFALPLKDALQTFKQFVDN